MNKRAVILPVYNGEENIIKTLDEILKFSKKNPNYKFIFVNDGSRDDTKLIIEKKIAESDNKNLKLISYEKNKGKGNAVKTGVKYAEEGLICFIDSDLPYSLDHLKTIFDKLEKFDIVIGSRGLVDNLRAVKISRKIIGRMFNNLSRLILGLKFRDMQAGLKGFRRDVAKEIFSKQRIKRFSFDTELMYIAKKKRFSIMEIPAKLSEDHYFKNSKVSVLRDSIIMFFDLFRIRLNHLLGKYD